MELWLTASQTTTYNKYEISVTQTREHSHQDQVGPQYLLPFQCVLSDRKMNDQHIKPSHTSNNSQNLVKIGQVDSEIVWLETGPLK